MTQTITQCPNCQTSFRVTLPQLDMADGAVRCGACLQVFSAADHLLAPFMDAAQAASVADQYWEDFEAWFFDTRDWRNSAFPDPLMPVQFETYADPPQDPEETKRVAEPGLESVQKPDDDPVQEESSVEQASDPTTETATAPTIAKVPATEPAETDVAVPWWMQHGSGQESQRQQEKAVPWWQKNATSQVANVDPDPPAGNDDQPEEAQKLTWPLVFPVVSDTTADVAATGVETETETETAPELEPEPEMESGAELAQAGTEAEPHGGDLHVETDAPIELAGALENVDLDEPPDDWLVDQPQPVRQISLAWLPAVVLLLVAGALQYLFFNMATYAQLAEYRPYYLSFCDYAGCDVPEYIDRDALIARELVIRSNPEVEDALVVDVLIQNSAAFRQRFPHLELAFYDIRGDLLAVRRFRVREYLGGELRGLQFIPAKTEVRVSLDIVDPGDDAVGYEMKVVL